MILSELLSLSIFAALLLIFEVYFTVPQCLGGASRSLVIVFHTPIFRLFVILSPLLSNLSGREATFQNSRDSVAFIGFGANFLVPSIEQAILRKFAAFELGN